MRGSPTLAKPAHAPVIAILLPNLRGGGAERVGVNLANEFVRRGISVDMVLMSNTGALASELNPGVRVVDLGAKRMRNVLTLLMRYLRAEHPAAILACMWPLTVIAPWAIRLAHVHTRVVVAEHTTLSTLPEAGRMLRRLLLRKSIRWSFPRTDGVVAVSCGAADDMAAFTGLHRSSITAIANPITGGAPQPSIAESDIVAPQWWHASTKRILAVGALKPEKDYPTLLRAFAKLRQAVDARLLILGEGDGRAQLSRLIDELRLRDCVDLPGFVLSPNPYYKRAHLHVLSSICEGFGNVIVESLEAGTPVVSTDCPSGPREILDDGRYGTLVRVGDTQSLARAMEAALSRTHDVTALKARAAEFSIGKAADAYLDLLLPAWKSRSTLGGMDDGT